MYGSSYGSSYGSGYASRGYAIFYSSFRFIICNHCFFLCVIISDELHIQLDYVHVLIEAIMTNFETDLDLFIFYLKWS